MIFFTDLDNTLIHSYKHQNDGDICVETKGKKELSYMTPRAFALLQEVNKKTCFIPVTTRTLEQYNRIFFFENAKPEFALVCNGAILLINGMADEKWHNETRIILGESLNLLKKYKKILEQNEDLFYDIRFADNFFIFCKRYPEKDIGTFLNGLIDNDVFDTCFLFSKAYIIPKLLNKGAAINRFLKRYGYQDFIAAGDSKLDIPMLKMAKFAFVPNSFEISNDNFEKPQDLHFSEFVLSKVLSYI